MFIHAYGFVDGGYLRKLATDHVKPLLDPHHLVNTIISRQGYTLVKNTRLVRVVYYDARPDDETDIDPSIQ